MHLWIQSQKSGPGRSGVPTVFAGSSHWLCWMFSLEKENQWARVNSALWYLFCLCQQTDLDLLRSGNEIPCFGCRGNELLRRKKERCTEFLILSDHQVPENPSMCVNWIILLLIQFPPLNVRSGGRTFDTRRGTLECNLHNTWFGDILLFWQR